MTKRRPRRAGKGGEGMPDFSAPGLLPVLHPPYRARHADPRPAGFWLRWVLRPPEGALPAHDLPLDQLAALLARTGLHLGNDAGVSHLAAAVGAPTVCLFGPTDASCWAPLGPRVRVVLAPQGNLERLGVETVAAAARALRSEALAPPCG